MAHSSAHPVAATQNTISQTWIREPNTRWVYAYHTHSRHT